MDPAEVNQVPEQSVTAPDAKVTVGGDAVPSDNNPSSEAVTQAPTRISRVLPPPPGQHNVLEVFAGEGDETEENLAAVESALAVSHLREATGFELIYKWLPCCFTLNIKPTLGHESLSIGVEGWRIDSESECGCFCCFCPRARRWKTVRLMQGGKEVLNFIYKPQVWWPGGKNACIVDIYVPERSKRIGWIKCEGGGIDAGNVIVADSISKSIFTISKYNTDSSTIAIKLSNNLGIPVALAHATRGYRRYGWSISWTEFVMKCSTSMASPTTKASAKAMLLVAYTMWILQYREHYLRWRFVWAGILLIVFFVTLIITTFTL